VTKGGFELTIDTWIEPETTNQQDDGKYHKLYQNRRRSGGEFNLPWDGKWYRICFSNQFSLLYDKTVYLSISTKEEYNPKDGQNKTVKRWVHRDFLEMDEGELVESMSENVLYSMGIVKFLKIASLQDDGIIAAMSIRIQFWSTLYTIVVIVTAVCQTYAIKQSFTSLQRRSSCA